MGAWFLVEEDLREGRGARGSGRASGAHTLAYSAREGQRVAWEARQRHRPRKLEDPDLRVPRSGRGHRLSRAQRKEVFACIESLTSVLCAQRCYSWEQLRDMSAQALVRGANEAEIENGEDKAAAASELRTRTGVHHHLVVDEAQDLTAIHWRMLRALVPAGPDDLFIAGDAHQESTGALSPCRDSESRRETGHAA